ERERESCLPTNYKTTSYSSLNKENNRIIQLRNIYFIIPVYLLDIWATLFVHTRVPVFSFYKFQSISVITFVLLIPQFARQRLFYLT
ncbi:hypothetical protein, partial [Dysgonomonas sp. HGC4]|uniref:hypothetical protein n=1 Tax=Dysgonomonas sp. HGC4 TaxID=1658009 RepID=UPI001C88B9F3